MTLFTKDDCVLCDQLKSKYDLQSMEVVVEVLGGDNAESLAHLAWHGLVETARKTLPLLVLDDSSTLREFDQIDSRLQGRAMERGIACRGGAAGAGCASGSCSL